MRATLLTLGLAAGLFGTAGKAHAQWVYPGGYYGGYSPYIAPTYSRGPFVGGRYLAVPNYGYGFPAYNYGAYNFGYGSGFGFPGYGYGYPYGGYGSVFRFGFSYGGFRY